MNTYILLFYLFYLPVTVFITVRVGWLCYVNGEYYIRDLLHSKPQLVIPLNKLLLTGYYLVNIGYVVVVLSQTPTINSVPALLSTLSLRIAVILLTLGVLHYINIFSLALLSKQFKHTIQKPLKK